MWWDVVVYCEGLDGELHTHEWSKILNSYRVG